MTFWVQEKQQYLEHCCPIVSTGQICEQNIEHFNAFFSHSSEPNCDQHCDRFTANNFRWGQENFSKGSHPKVGLRPPYSSKCLKIHMQYAKYASLISFNI